MAGIEQERRKEKLHGGRGGTQTELSRAHHGPGVERGDTAEAVSGDVTAENFPKVMKDAITPPTQEARQRPKQNAERDPHRGTRLTKTTENHR